MYLNQLIDNKSLEINHIIINYKCISLTDFKMME